MEKENIMFIPCGNIAQSFFETYRDGLQSNESDKINYPNWIKHIPHPSMNKWSSSYNSPKLSDNRNDLESELETLQTKLKENQASINNNRTKSDGLVEKALKIMRIEIKLKITK